MKHFTAVGTLFLLMMPLLVLGCGESSSRQRSKDGPRGNFQFPEGWSKLSEEEWRTLELGENRTLVTIMDAERIASFSAIRVPLDPMTESTSRILGDEVEARTAVLIQSLDAAGPGQYENYKLLTKGAAEFAGRGVGEIVYQGKNPGKELRWYRIVVIAGRKPTEPLLMLVHSAPQGREGEFEQDFAAIEASWKWRD